METSQLPSPARPGLLSLPSSPLFIARLLDRPHARTHAHQRRQFFPCSDFFSSELQPRRSRGKDEQAAAYRQQQKQLQAAMSTQKIFFPQKIDSAIANNPPLSCLFDLLLSSRYAGGAAIQAFQRCCRCWCRFSSFPSYYLLPFLRLIQPIHLSFCVSCFRPIPAVSVARGTQVCLNACFGPQSSWSGKILPSR